MPYRIHGVVVEEESGEPLAGLLVRAFDQDLLKDDFLGEVRTDREGRFEIEFTEVQFMDLFETQPDVFVRVYDPTGSRLLWSLEDQVVRNTVSDAAFQVRIPRARSAAS